MLLTKCDYMWHKETEQKPPFDTTVLCYCRIYGYYLGYYFRIDHAFNNGNWCDRKDKGVLPPIAWQYLPLPPNI
jgi:hypothetical protein